MNQLDVDILRQSARDNPDRTFDVGRDQAKIIIGQDSINLSLTPQAFDLLYLNNLKFSNDGRLIAMDAWDGSVDKPKVFDRELTPERWEEIEKLGATVEKEVLAALNRGLDNGIKG